MWIFAAAMSAVFAAITAILSKCGVKNIDSDSATAIRTSVVAVAAWAGLFILTCGTICMALFTWFRGARGGVGGKI